MNQTKLIVRFGVALLLLAGPLCATAAAAPSKADSEQTPAKTVTVRGVVYDDQGQPLPGASVLVKGTTQGTVTDLDGRYTLNVRPGQTLIVSFMGFKDMEIPADGKMGSIVLESDNVLEDAVVVGYGSIKKENLTGAVAQIDSKVFESRPIANAQLMIDGVIPNVQTAITDGHPARQTGLDVRGKSGSLSALYVESDATTLILIDGVEGDLAYINPDDIESISVLKDAASAAIYGSRGPMGVILVTTKSATQKTERPIVTYSGSVNIGTPRSMPDLVTDTVEWAQAMVDAYKNYYNGTVPNLARFGSVNKINGETYIENYKAWYADPANVGNTAVDKKGNYTYYGNTDWFDYIYKKRTLAQTHNVSVNGNNGRTSYLISGRLYDYDGLVKGDSDNYTTANLRTKLETQVFSWLRLKENISYTHDFYDMAISSGGDALVTPQSMMLAWGNPSFVPYNPDGTFTAAGWRILSGMEGPWADRNYKNKTTQTFRTTTGATAAFFDNHLRFNADFTYQSKSYDVKQQWTNILFSNVEGEMTPALADKNLYKQAVKEQFKWINYKTFNAYTEYENTFAKHYLKAMVGYNYETRTKREFEIRKRGLDPEKANSINPYWAATGEFGANDGELNNKVMIYRNAGVFFRLNYNYAERYLLEIDGRYDGSSYFSKNYQWHFFPAVSAAWRVSQEPWWKINPMFWSSLKFRASYGSLGDAMSVGAYAYQETFNPDTSDSRVINGLSNVSIYTIPGELNSQFGWSTITTKDAGVDLGFINNKLNMTFDYYIRSNTNMVVDGEKQSVTFGSDSAKGNYAGLSTYGWEFELNYHDSFMLGGRPFGFGLRAGLADNYTIVDKYPGDENNLVSSNNAHYQGERLGEIWGFHVNPDCPIFQNEDQIANAFGQGVPYKMSMTQTHNDKKTYPGDVWLLDLDGDNDINQGQKTLADHGDMEIIGNFYPRYQYNFGIDLSYANFFLNAQFNGVAKMDIPLQNDHLLYAGYTQRGTTALTPLTKWSLQNAWSESNPNAFMPALNMKVRSANKAYGLIGAKYQTLWSNHLAQYPIDRYLINGAYINMQNIQFGYNIPKKVISKIGLTAAKVYFAGENLWNWSPMYKTYGRDFDVQTIVRASDDTIEGYSITMNGSGGLQYPILRTYSFGVSLTFGGGTDRVAAGAAAANSELAKALAAANAAADAAKAAADKAQAEADALKAELAKALKAKEDCENAPKPMAVRRAEALHLEDIYFELNQSVIRDSETYKVNNLVKVLKANPEAKVSITGYADQGTGTELRNLVLTKERAEVVAEALKAAGIGPDRIHTEFYGTEKDSSWTPENNRLAVCIVNN